MRIVFNCAFVSKFCLFKIVKQILITYYKISVTVEYVAQRIIYLLMYHVIFVMFCWSYWQTVFTDVGFVPQKVSMFHSYLLRGYKLIKQ